MNCLEIKVTARGFEFASSSTETFAAGVLQYHGQAARNYWGEELVILRQGKSVPLVRKIQRLLPEDVLVGDMLRITFPPVLSPKTYWDHITLGTALCVR